MWPTALDTLRRALRHPGTWLLVLLGAFVAWCGLSLGILALGNKAIQARAVVVATAQTFAVLATLWVLALALEQDAGSDLALAADCTAPGRAGRFLGRWAGSVVVGACVGLILQAGLQTATGKDIGAPISLYFAIIVVSAFSGAWGLLLGAVGGSGQVLLPGLLIWVAGHLPWGSPALLPGWSGHALAAWLPSPIPPRGQAAGSLASSTLAILGLLALGIAVRWGPGRPRWIARTPPTGGAPPATPAPLRGPR